MPTPHLLQRRAAACRWYTAKTIPNRTDPDRSGSRSRRQVFAQFSVCSLRFPEAFRFCLVMLTIYLHCAVAAPSFRRWLGKSFRVKALEHFVNIDDPYAYLLGTDPCGLALSCGPAGTAPPTRRLQGPLYGRLCRLQLATCNAGCLLATRGTRAKY